MDFFEDDLILQNYLGLVEDTFIISKTNNEGIITYVNDAFCQISGFTKDELIGKPHNIVRHPQVPSKVFKQMWDTIQKGNVFHGVIKNRAKDGSTYITDAKIYPLITDNGIEEYLSVRVDITQFALAKEQQILDASEKFKIILDKDGLIVGFNNNATNTFSFLKVGETLHSCIYEAVDYKNANRSIKNFTVKINGIIIDFLANGQQIQEETIEFNNKTYLLETERLSNDFMMIFTDISDVEDLKKKHDIDLQQSKDEMLVVFTHELKTPLNGIIGFSEVLDKRLQGAKQKELKEKDIDKFITIAQDINALGNMLYNTVMSLLDSAKIKSGQYQLNITKFTASDIILKHLTLVNKVYNQDSQYSFEDFEIESDQIAIERIFVNLYSNALKYGDGKAFTTLKKKDNKFYLIVEDNGSGVSEEDRMRIWDMFDQLDDKELTRDAKGTGIGLFLVKQLCDLLDYKIEITTSQKLGGASFVVSGNLKG